MWKNSSCVLHCFSLCLRVQAHDFCYQSLQYGLAGDHRRWKLGMLTGRYQSEVNSAGQRCSPRVHNAGKPSTSLARKICECQDVV
jgi:hypothetical protein